MFEEIHQEVLCLRTLKKGNTRNIENYRPIYFPTVLFMIETINYRKKEYWIKMNEIFIKNNPYTAISFKKLEQT